MDEQSPYEAPSPGPSDSSASSSNEQTVHAPRPTRPRISDRQSSGTMIVPRDSSDVGPVESRIQPGDVRAMSPRRTGEDLEAMGQEARAELRRLVAVVRVLVS